MSLSGISDQVSSVSGLEWVGFAGFLLALVLGYFEIQRYFRGFDLHITGINQISAGTDGVVIAVLVAVVNKSSRAKVVPRIEFGVNNGLGINPDLEYKFDVAGRTLVYKIPYLPASIKVPEDLYGRTPAVVQAGAAGVFISFIHLVTESQSALAQATLRAIAKDWNDRELASSDRKLAESDLLLATLPVEPEQTEHNSSDERNATVEEISEAIKTKEVVQSMNVEIFTLPVFPNGQSLKERIQRIDTERKENWVDIKRGTLTASSGIFVLSFVALQLNSASNTWLLVSAWFALSAAVGIVLASFWIDHSISESTQKLFLKMGDLMKDVLTEQSRGNTISGDELRIRLDKLQEDDQPNEAYRKKQGRRLNWAYVIANLSLVSGVILLIAFGISNLP